MNSSTDQSSLLTAKSNRRNFLRRALGASAGAALVPAALSLGGSNARADETSDELATDLLVLNFALNLEYLEAQFYSLAVTGQTIEANGVAVDGKGKQGTTLYKSGSSTQVPFQTPAIQQYAMEINNDETSHVKAIRATITALGSKPRAIPAIDLLNSFNGLAVAAGLGSSFDPFENETNFLLGSFIFEDVGVTAYHGGAPLITNKDVLSAAAGILAVEAYHASIVRTVLYSLGSETQAAAQKISDVRDELGSPKTVKDQGLLDASGNANIVPTDANGIAYSRNVRQVLNIVYAGFHASSGGFYPNGMNLPA